MIEENTRNVLITGLCLGEIKVRYRYCIQETPPARKDYLIGDSRSVRSEGMEIFNGFTSTFLMCSIKDHIQLLCHRYLSAQGRENDLYEMADLVWVAPADVADGALTASGKERRYHPR